MNATGQRTVAAVTRHLMPPLGPMYLIAYIDRQNVSYTPSCRWSAISA
ncbi:hypothetical protein [Benzoatithermus flavus]|uniref:Uncharacterized protein n=1 Tax=Benzoatithermus flavus TaxID=3108223 RepID=A0ABU8XNX7_9PROT